ncbi:MAG: methylated-DNA--[protein]-cysteine S-methyltransferase [Acidimicrobiia bacterium]|nr:methylated-DNA--[protein]-cysteine S-methyltransferase [Acidimicrobiia bacterium]
MTLVRWWCQPTPIGELGIVVTAAAVQRISLPESEFDPPPDAAEQRDDAIARQLDEYFDGARRRIDAEVDLSTMTGPFRRAVLETLRREVPWGETVTYGELAAMSGRPRAARAVGTAMASNPVPLLVPCHRVLAANGLGGYGGADGRPDLKRALLALEGVHVA